MMAGSAQWQLEGLFHQTHKVHLLHCLSEIPAFPRELSLPVIDRCINELGVINPQKKKELGVINRKKHDGWNSPCVKLSLNFIFGNK
jgi:hypothetical protein